jgi:hypothetical protein
MKRQCPQSVSNTIKQCRLPAVHKSSVSNIIETQSQASHSSVGTQVTQQPQNPQYHEPYLPFLIDYDKTLDLEADDTSSVAASIFTAAKGTVSDMTPSIPSHISFIPAQAKATEAAEPWPTQLIMTSNKQALKIPVISNQGMPRSLPSSRIPLVFNSSLDHSVHTISDNNAIVMPQSQTPFPSILRLNSDLTDALLRTPSSVNTDEMSSFRSQDSDMCEWESVAAAFEGAMEQSLSESSASDGLYNSIVSDNGVDGVDIGYTSEDSRRGHVERGGEGTLAGVEEREGCWRFSLETERNGNPPKRGRPRSETNKTAYSPKTESEAKHDKSKLKACVHPSKEWLKEGNVNGTSQSVNEESSVTVEKHSMNPTHAFKTGPMQQFRTLTPSKTSSFTQSNNRRKMLYRCTFPGCSKGALAFFKFWSFPFRTPFSVHFLYDRMT